LWVAFIRIFCWLTALQLCLICLWSNCGYYSNWTFLGCDPVGTILPGTIMFSPSSDYLDWLAQLAEAILTEQADTDDDGSILLTDRRTGESSDSYRRPSTLPQADLEGTDTTTLDEQAANTSDGRYSGETVLMENDEGEDSGSEDGDGPSRGLSSKAGIILVFTYYIAKYY
jgi:hypothetical protein